MFKYDAFLSYSSKDKSIVHALAKRLRQDGLRVWLDVWVIKPGDSIPLKIQQGLEKSHILVMCMSQAYFKSEWGKMEHYTILFRDPVNTQSRLIPLLIADCTRPDIIAHLAYIDWRTCSDKEYEKLLASCLEKSSELSSLNLSSGVYPNNFRQPLNNKDNFAEKQSPEVIQQPEILEQIENIGQKTPPNKDVTYINKYETSIAMNFPDCIYGLGGAGKELIFNMLKQEWILKEILKPAYVSKKCVVIIVDTCFEDENKDKETINEIKKNIRKITQEYVESRLDSGLSVSEIKIIYHLLTKELLLKRPVDLGGRDVKNRVLLTTDAKCWWINDDQISIDWYKKIRSKENLQNLNFTKGVYRNRAIAKAIYYKALSENKFKIEVPGRNIDIICGLGGGTGSGIVLSLAKKIKEMKPGSNIQLFGVIPTLNESDDEKANCASMLCELEYMKVNDSGSEINTGSTDIYYNNVFKSIVLLPIEPTRYGGEQALDTKCRKQILEYDDVFPYVLIAFHNTQGTQPEFLDSQGFAPFSIAIPQLVRYNVNYLKNIQDFINEYISEKKNSLGSENRIYDSINSYLTKFFDTNIKNNQNENVLGDDIVFIEERYEQFKSVLNCKYFEELQYTNILGLKNIVKTIDRKKSNENESNCIKIESLIKNIQSQIEGECLNFRDDVSNAADYSIYKILVEDLGRIDSLIQIIKEINSLSDNLIIEALKNCFKPDESLGNQISKIRDAIEAAEEEKRSLNQEYQELEEKYIEFEDKIKKTVKYKDKKWKDDSKDLFKHLVELEAVSPNLVRSFESLKTTMEIYVNEINRAEKESIIKEIDTSNLENKFFDLFTYGIHPIDYREIISISKGIKLADVKSKQKLLWDKIVPGDTKAKRDVKEARKRRDILLCSLNQLLSDSSNLEGIQLTIVFSESKFSFTFNFVIEEYIRNKVNEDIELILKDLKEEYLNKDTKILFEELESKLKAPVDNKIINIDEILKVYGKYRETIQMYENMKKIKVNQIEELSTRLERYKRLESLLLYIIYYHEILYNLSKYNSYFLNADKSYEDRRSLLGTEMFVTELQPYEIFEILAYSSDINKVIRDEKERQRLLKEVKNSFHKISTRQYNNLTVNSFSTEEISWDRTTLGCAMITKAKNIEEDVFDGIYTDLRDKFCIAETNHFNNWLVPYGDDWGVGIVSFIYPILLDNIYNFIDVPSGYFQSYQKIKMDSDKIFIFHNSLLLEEGKFIERVKVFDLENSDEIKRQFLEDKKKAKELIVNNIQMKNLSDLAKTIK